MDAKEVSWFSINTESLGYINIMGAIRANEVVADGTASQTFSDVHWYSYALVIAPVLLLGYFFFWAAGRFELKFASFWKVAIVLSVVFCIYSAFFIALLWNIPFGDIPEKLREGTFGDSFGTLNTLFSGLAFSGVIISLFLQRKDLADTRVQTLHQQIESQFYNMLALQQGVVQSFDLQSRLPDSVVIAKGRDCFREWYGSLREIYEHTRGLAGTRRALAFSQLREVHAGDLALYFRSLYSVFRYVYECDHDNKAFFGRVARSLLSDYELVLIFYNCLDDRGGNFKLLSYEFSLFDNLEPYLLLDLDDIRCLDRWAYGNNAGILRLHAEIS